jgi:hypothetical protein
MTKGGYETGDISDIKDFRNYSRDNSVGIAMGYGLDGWGSIPGRSKRFVFFPQPPDWLPLPTQLPVQ